MVKTTLLFPIQVNEKLQTLLLFLSLNILYLFLGNLLLLQNILILVRLDVFLIRTRKCLTLLINPLVVKPSQPIRPDVESLNLIIKIFIRCVAVGGIHVIQLNKTRNLASGEGINILQVSLNLLLQIR